MPSRERDQAEPDSARDLDPLERQAICETRRIRHAVVAERDGNRCLNEADVSGHRGTIVATFMRTRTSPAAGSGASMPNACIAA